MCEHCGKESEDKDEVLFCEAQHLGLTIDEKRQYDHLEAKVAQWSNVVARTNNEATRSALDSVITELLVFEVQHGMGKKG